MDILAALQTRSRLEQLGMVIRSAFLDDEAATINAFVGSGGNREMRRAATRAQRKRGKGYTR